jgi:glycosyltransferase involved in cell wall biosynthesis
VLDEGLLRVAPAKERVRLWAPHGRRVILTVARLAASEQYKGHDVVLRALPQVIEREPNLTYLIVGDGDDRPRLETVAERLKLRDHVVFTGRVSDEELAACYRACEVFVLPARTVLDERDPKGEGFGIVFLEAMAFGKPVIGPACGAPVELIRQGEHGLLVKPEDPAAVADAVLRLLNSPEEARRMGESGSQWVREEHSYQSFCRRLREALGD